jgi:hypothetical protein
MLGRVVVLGTMNHHATKVAGPIGGSGSTLGRYLFPALGL